MTAPSRTICNIAAICVSAAITAYLNVPADAQQVQWNKLPRMQLEKQYAGPFQDTVIQRWRDPADDMICYLYIPITAAHTPPDATGYVQYGTSNIGSISCIGPVPTKKK